MFYCKYSFFMGGKNPELGIYANISANESPALNENLGLGELTLMLFFRVGWLRLEIF